MFVILIPAYEPDSRLVTLVGELSLRLPHTPIMIVDDGSGPAYAPIFDAAARVGASVLAHTENRGKGAALRTGFAAIASVWPGAAVVTADCDGQHTAADIVAVAAALEDAPEDDRVVVLGCRAFAGEVPARSRLGNTVTRWAYRAATGQDIPDTQTGLRALSPAAMDWAQTLPGDRFEYEFQMLLRAPESGVRLATVPIETIYTDGNSSSHFRPLRDSARIYAPLLRFAGSGLLAFGVDTVALLVLNALTGHLLASVVGARLISASVNFVVNRSVVFGHGREVPARTAALRYGGLAVILLAANYGLLSALTGIGIPLIVAKIATEAALFIASYAMQRSVVFSPESPRLDTPVLQDSYARQ
ncbi:bifunctional glycosyltransferase family 2/GtrA family protein [Tessaracoccus caeni]|uniref:bifunctional glycosyltransferase family 2/GtrA family protein n=1 Tax=Tessaracoccus caeni TaxID=3031239 RepID=UPI0023DCC879|nr:bifunctional glycosyltransferase family 2/GtrA family protein [Tessaracoccus caeni]MDF1488896.1 bifunctional glycosyltransferase family 2/GtrA family protein [Tessaracoccus caeni]